jgi:CRP/FNR family transcriptional regulator
MATALTSSPTAMMAVAPWLSGTSIEHIDSGHTMTCITLRNYAENEHLFLEGDIQTHIYLVISGVIALYKALSDGRRQICSFAYPGDIIGLDCIDSHVNSAEALCKTRLRCIPVNAIEKLMRAEPGFGQALLVATASELADTREQMLSLGRKSASEKLASFLLRISRRNAAFGGSEDMLAIPMKRCEIADFLGLTTETVSRTFTRFKTMNIIRLNSISEVEILDHEKLESAAGGLSHCGVH